MKHIISNNRVVKNASWIIGIQIIKSVIGFAISILTARYLGPSNYGIINYAASIVTFVTPIMYLGLNGILVQEVVNRPENEGETLGTAITLSFISSLVCVLGVFAFISIANAGEKETIVVCILYSVLLIFQSLDLIQYWFQAKLLSKYSSIVSLCAYLAISSYRAFLLITGKSIRWFAVSQAIDIMLISLSLFVIYRKLGGIKLSFSWDAAKKMTLKSKYYILSNMMIVIFSQTDRIMLKLMVDDSATGFYSVAVICAGLTSFVFSSIIDSMRPMIFENKKKDNIKYENSIITLYSIVIYTSFLYSVVVTVFSYFIIRILYGTAYLVSVGTLQILVWYCAFSYLGGARDVWILAENKQKQLVLLNAVGAVSNVILNYVLIPIWGANGAAVASLITQFVVNVVLVFTYKPLRPSGVLIIKACNPRILIGTVKKIINKE